MRFSLLSPDRAVPSLCCSSSDRDGGFIRHFNSSHVEHLRDVSHSNEDLFYLCTREETFFHFGATLENESLSSVLSCDVLEISLLMTCDDICVCPLQNSAEFFLFFILLLMF